MRRLPIKWKLGLVGLLCALGMLTLFMLNHYTAKRIAELGNIRLQVSELTGGMLMLRRNEKDFLARNNLRYAKKFTNNYRKLKTKVAQLIQKMEQQDMDASEAKQLDKTLEQYAQRFASLVEIQKRVGLSHKSGLQGSLRNAVHAAEKRLNALGDILLIKDMLMLRRREKDFLLRMDSRYLKKFDKDYAAFMHDLEGRPLSDQDKNLIRADMTRYKQDFHAMAKGYETKGLTSEQGVLGDMRNTVHKTETQLKKMAEQANQHVTTAIRQMERIAMILSLGLIAVLAAFIIYLSATIRRPLIQLSRLMQRVSAENNLTLRAKVNGHDEVAEYKIRLHSSEPRRKN